MRLARNGLSRYAVGLLFLLGVILLVTTPGRTRLDATVSIAASNMELTSSASGGVLKASTPAR